MLECSVYEGSVNSRCSLSKADAFSVRGYNKALKRNGCTCRILAGATNHIYSAPTQRPQILTKRPLNRQVDGARMSARFSKKKKGKYYSVATWA